jgi:hypothetical protein
MAELGGLAIMIGSLDPKQVESSAYRKVLSDGIIDTFVGLSLVWVGSAWLWLEGVAGIAGVLPAVLVAPMLGLRKRVMEPRTGYVRFGAARRAFERRNLIVLFLMGIGMFAVGVAAAFVFVLADGRESAVDRIMPGLFAWLLALALATVALIFDVRRFALYAGALVIAGVLAAEETAHPGLPLLTGGGVISVIGAAVLEVDLHRNPIVRQP